MSATAIIYQAAGAPDMEGDTPGVCRSCGSSGVGVPFEAWVKPTFVDFDKLQPGEIVCHSCLFCFSDRCAELTALTGRDKPQRMRTYSHFVTRGAWAACHKGQKAEMRAALLDSETSVAVVSVTGQKHLIFRAVPCRWQIEEESVFPFRHRLGALLDRCDELYSGGFSKTEIETGRWSQNRIIAFGLDRWRELENVIGHERGTVRLALAVFLAAKEDHATQGDRGEAAVPAVAGNPQRVQEPIPPDDLAAVRKPDPRKRLHQLGLALE